MKKIIKQYSNINLSIIIVIIKFKSNIYFCKKETVDYLFYMLNATL
jgi:hypothetical protein